MATLIDYLWGSHQPPVLLCRAHGYAEVAPASGEPVTANQPSAPAMAATIHLYPRFMVAVGSPGAPSIRPRHEDESGTPLARTAIPPSLARLGTGEYARLPDADRIRLARPLRGPQTTIVELATVTDLRNGRRRGAPCIELQTPTRNVWLGPDPDSASAIAATRWEPRLYGLLSRLSGHRRDGPPELS